MTSVKFGGNLLRVDRSTTQKITFFICWILENHGVLKADCDQFYQKDSKIASVAGEL
ncbi:MAG: hypothetical protein ACOX4X_01030 [Aminobacterium colombiense]|uniref:hypothetical protein n=1 Tax=Aminobacterium colombiense TaxID=81468 RepID=UPI003D98983B